MTDEMDHPVTRRELREELASYPTRKELHEALEIWGGELENRLERKMLVIGEHIAAHVTAQVTAHTSAEIARHVTASEERIRADMRAMLDPHHGVPDRVTGLEARVDRLELKVLAPKRRRRTARRR